jgi:hypothetical protein
MAHRSYLSSVLLAFVMSATVLLGSPAIGDPESSPTNIGAGPRGKGSKTHSVPEIEVAGLVAAGTLLVGGLAIAAARRRKSRKA